MLKKKRRGPGRPVSKSKNKRKFQKTLYLPGYIVDRVKAEMKANDNESFNDQIVRVLKDYYTNWE